MGVDAAFSPHPPQQQQHGQVGFSPPPYTARPDLPPQPQPFGIFPNFAPDQYTNLILQDNLFSVSGNDYQIRDQYGNCVLQADGKFFSLRSETRLNDAHGQPMVTIRRKLLSIFTDFAVFGIHDDNVPLFRAEGKWSPLKPKFTVWLTDAVTNRPVQLEVVGNWLEWKADIRIVQTGAVIARLHRDYSRLGGFIAGRDTYIVEVAPRVDLVLVSALGIIFNERKRQQRGK